MSKVPNLGLHAPPLGRSYAPYAYGETRTMSKVLGGWELLMSEVPLYCS